LYQNERGPQERKQALKEPKYSIGDQTEKHATVYE